MLKQRRITIRITMIIMKNPPKFKKGDKKMEELYEIMSDLLNLECNQNRSKTKIKY